MTNYLTTAEAAERLGGIHPSRVRHLILDGRLKAEKFGRDYRIAEKDLAAVANRPAGWRKGRKRKPEPTP